ncbi:MAG: hypothetical protein D8M58_14970 [Calditrichaeota bacterium]|nr:MAG: hypothetical protein DWQ03_16210 [Calditrichota bacterium]MBL1206705.1 hypothetical protein [Calditrichota bacterium]NOG46531.1 tetratricopeptide repeat protein [Calditrichota bacterium]
MSFKTLSKWFSYLLVFILLQHSTYAQSGSMTDDQFSEHLKTYINKLLTRYGEQNIEKERYLVQQIRMINEEIKSRVGSVSDKRAQYFDKLQGSLSEIKALKNRLPASATQLYSFIDDLETRIESTIDKGVMDYKRQRVFDDAVQLLYLAEELIKLDPAINLSANPQIIEGLNKANQKMVSTFGAATGKTTSSSAGASSIFDVYHEWQRTERIKYHLRVTDIELIKKRLIKKSTVGDLKRMFGRELQHSVQAFNFRYFELAQLSFAEILKKYGQIGELDDVLYYMAESNYQLGRFNMAEEQFEELISDYPSSSYAPKTYKRLIEITSHFERYSESVEHFRQMQNIISSSDAQYEEALLLAINASLNGKFFEDAVSLSYEINPQSPLYDYARFIQSKALAGAQNFEEAYTVLSSILETANLEPDFRFDILAKMGYIQYELGNPQKAITHYDEIAGNYSNYDRVLMGYGWAFYKLEISKMISDRNFKNAKQYLELVISNFLNSEYNLEARTLLGYINQLEFDTKGAIDNFRFAYNAKEIKQHSDNLNEQQLKLEDIVKTSGRLEKQALESKNLEAFNRAVTMRKKVEQPLFKLKYADLSPVGMAATNEVGRLKSQLQELDRLKQKATEKNDDVLVERIESMQLKIYRAINSYPLESSTVLGFNYFDEHPLARKESVVESENKKIAQMRAESSTERQEIARKISRLDVQIQNAKSRRDYKKLANLEISKDRFNDLLKKLDYLDTWVFSMKMNQTNINLGRWSDYGAFGLANVNFAIRSQQKEQIGQMREQIQKINDLLMKRKQNVVHKIRQIQNEITLMTRRVRRQERIREREELNRQFEESYFDTHETETNETDDVNNTDNTIPPSFEEDESDQ